MKHDIQLFSPLPPAVAFSFAEHDQDSYKYSRREDVCS